MRPTANWIIGLLVILCNCLLYIYVGYYLPRTEFYILLSCWVFLFGSSYYLVSHSSFSFKQLAAIAILFRISLLFEIPNLSQDFYRFIWDGRMLLNGFNPYLYTPKNLVELNKSPVFDALTLFKGMGMLNASHYTNYPPFSQLCYFIAALFGSKSILVSVIVMRLQIIAADVGILLIGQKILAQLQLSSKKIFLYALNPFIIIELTGNLHFEAVMAFFMVLSLYFLFKKQWILAGIALGFSVSVKLITLMFLPVFFLYFFKNQFVDQKITSKTKPFSLQNVTRFYYKLKTPNFFLKFKKWCIKKSGPLLKYTTFCLIVIGTNLLLFAPFLSVQFITNFSKTISLWFQNFEFNASIFYIVRWVGFKVVGWNIIAKAGKILPLIAIACIACFSLIRKNYKPVILIESMLFSITAYLLLSTTVHPWYLTIPLSLSCFTKFKYLWLWSFTIIFSYFAYSNIEFKENLFLVATEYLIVILFLGFELFYKPKKSHFNTKAGLTD